MFEAFLQVTIEFSEGFFEILYGLICLNLINLKSLTKVCCFFCNRLLMDLDYRISEIEKINKNYNYCDDMRKRPVKTICRDLCTLWLLGVT